MNTHVVAWSGGPDSTYTLQRLLETTDEPVVAVCCFVGPERYRTASKRAVRRLGMLLHRIRAFEIHQQELISVDRSQGVFATEGMTLVVLSVAVCYDNPIIYWSRCREDAAATSFHATHRTTIDYLFTVCRSVAEIREMGAEIPKAVIRTALGPLWPITWSCFAPTRVLEPCGACNKCEERVSAEENTNANV